MHSLELICLAALGAILSPVLCVECPYGSICVSSGICSVQDEHFISCGKDLVCCKRIVTVNQDKIKLHDPDPKLKENYSDPPNLSKHGKEKSRGSKKTYLSEEARDLLRSYTYKGECGVRRLSHGKISTGHTVDSGITSYAEFPWQAVILIRQNRIKEGYGYSDAYKYHCGGVLIDKAVILTAAHCVYGVRIESFKIKLGEYNLQGTRGEIFPVIERRVGRKIIHDRYSPNKLVHDIAILMLDRPVDFRRTPHISPVCIPPKDLRFEKYTKCFITGYGEDVFKPNYGSNILKSASVNLHEENDCKDMLFKSIKKLSSGFLDSSQRCFTGSSGRDACTGDGGGPVVCPISNEKVPVCTGGYGCEPEHYFLAGIISWGSEECGEENSVTVITDVIAHRSWIFNELDRSGGYKHDRYKRPSFYNKESQYGHSKYEEDPYETHENNKHEDPPVSHEHSKYKEPQYDSHIKERHEDSSYNSHNYDKYDDPPYDPHRHSKYDESPYSQYKPSKFDH